MSIKEYIQSKWIPIRGNIKTYKPLYDYYKPFLEEEPEIYNKWGDRLKPMFLRDVHFARSPYAGIGKYFFWDRYNWGLKTHFYTHRAMLQTMGCPQKRYGMFIESRSIVPKDYEILQRHKGLEKEFDAIFTFDDVILNEVSNAKFFPYSAGIWYGKKHSEIISDRLYEHKNKNVSFLCSDKIMCDMHAKRMAVAQYCHSNGLADVYGRVIGGDYVDIELPLTDYRFSFAIENNSSDYYFTEKITNCFASQTIPIYWGAKKINEFFNEEGIIRIDEKDFENIEHIIKQCTKEEYERRLPAVLDNYQRVQEYNNMQDYLYEHYLKV